MLPRGRKRGLIVSAVIGPLMPTTGLFGVGGILAPRWSSVTAITPGSKGSQNQVLLGKLLVSNRPPLTWISSFFSAPRTGPEPVLFTAVFLAPSAMPGIQHSLNKHLLSKSLGEKVRPAGQCTKDRALAQTPFMELRGWVECKRD